MPSLPPPDPHGDPRKSPTGGLRWFTVAAEGAVAVLYLAAAASGSIGFFDSLPSVLKATLVFAAVALLLLRRKLPLMALLGLAAIAGALPTAGLLTAAVAYTAARRVEAPRQRVGLLLTAAGLPLLISILGTLLTDYGGWVAGFALGAVVAGAGVAIPGLVGTSAGQQERLLRALRDRAASAEEARRLADDASRVEERSRIAAEMHDLVGHRLSLISLHTGGLEMALATKAPELKDDAAQIRLATRGAMQELREVLGVLGPLGRDTGTEALTDATGTRPDIEALAEESRAAGIPVTFTWRGPDLDTLEPRVRRAVHRVVRESLTNVHRYATGAAVELTVTHTAPHASDRTGDGITEHTGEPTGDHAADRITVRVRNGAPPTSPEATTGLGTGRGLTGLRERLRLLGGELHTGPTLVRGFLVEATLPSRPHTPTPPDGAGAGPPRTTGPATAAPRASRALRQLPGAAAALLGLAGVGAMLFFGLAMVESSRTVAESTPDRTVRTGMTKERVRMAAGSESDLARAAATGREPSRPPGTDCYFPFETETVPETGTETVPETGTETVPETGTETVPETGTETVPETGTETGRGPGTDTMASGHRIRLTRYCFRDGVLVDIARFTVPLAPETEGPVPPSTPPPHTP
ncbi:histidine kinase [Streptomyces sp. NPDC101393]|uniref:histidine kinase n=1 Tax=Streptomyces sp. NPDC101393 TaxID=3366141 RepID=UPI00380C7157